MEPEEMLHQIGQRIEASLERGEKLDDELIAFVDTTYALVAEMYMLVHKNSSN